MADPDFVEGFPMEPAVETKAETPKEPPVLDDPPLLPPADEAEDVDDGEEGEEEVLETIEVEIEGKTYIVPKAVEQHLLREEDYTQKTQTLAEQRKEMEAYQQTLAEKVQIQEAVLEDIAQVRGLDAQIAEYDKIDWPKYQLQDPNAAQYHWMQFQQLQGFRGKAAQALNEKMQHVSSLQSKARDETIQKTITALSKPDPEYGWPGYSAAHMDRLDKAAAEIFGLSNEERTRITSAKSIKILNAAVMGIQGLKKAASSSATPTVEAKPVRQVPSARGRSGSSISGDEMPVDKWVERERAREAKRLNGLSRT